MKYKFKSLKQFEEQKERAQDRWDLYLEDIYSKECIKILLWFKLKFPKRTLQWLDGMGTNCWVLDGEIWDCDVYETYGERSMYSGNISLRERGWTRKEILLAPLVNFYTSINDTTYTMPRGVSIGDKEIT